MGNIQLRVCLHEGGGPQIGEVTFGGSPHLSCKRDQIKMRDYVDRRVTHQSGLPHLPGVPHLHVNRPLVFFSLLKFATVTGIKQGLRPNGYQSLHHPLNPREVDHSTGVLAPTLYEQHCGFFCASLTRIRKVKVL